LLQKRWKCRKKSVEASSQLRNYNLINFHRMKNN
jgi:hypothetical protein